VLVTMLGVVALCAVGAGVVALATGGGGGDRSSVGAPVTTDAGTTSTTPAVACAGSPPNELAVPAGFGNGVAGPAKQATTKPAATQQVTNWSSDSMTIEMRWPADADAVANAHILPTPADPGGGSMGSPGQVVVDKHGSAHQTTIYTFSALPPECANVQVTVYGSDAAAVGNLAHDLLLAPWRSTVPTVVTTAAATSTPTVAACPGPPEALAVAVKVPFVATIGGAVTRAAFPDPRAALADFLTSDPRLLQQGYQELRLDDSSISYAVEARPGVVVTTVHVVPSNGGWMVDDWRASGC
jgi:hypothetical protein